MSMLPFESPQHETPAHCYQNRLKEKKIKKTILFLKTFEFSILSAVALLKAPDRSLCLILILKCWIFHQTFIGSQKKNKEYVKWKIETGNLLLQLKKIYKLLSKKYN